MIKFAHQPYVYAAAIKHRRAMLRRDFCLCCGDSSLPKLTIFTLLPSCLALCGGALLDAAPVALSSSLPPAPSRSQHGIYTSSPLTVLRSTLG